MIKSLYARMLIVYLLIIIVSFALLGGIFFETLKSQFLDNQMEEMQTRAADINVWYGMLYYGEISDAEFQSLVLKRAQEDGIVIWLISRYGQVYFNADPEQKSAIDEALSSESMRYFLNNALEGKPVRQTSNVSSAFKGAVMSVSIPLKVDDTIKGALVVHKEMEDVGVGISSIFRQVFVPLVISVGVASLLVFILSRYVVRPIREISRAAGELSRGNLDWRVQPTTQDELGELAEAFNKMAAELKLQDSLRNTFIANVSHELRTPLASVQGFVQGMLDRAIEESDRDKYLEIVLAETKRMNALISDLLILAKIESGKFPMEYSEFDINELLRRCLLMFEKRIDEKQLEVDIRLSDEKLLVWADEDRISQVIMNLVDNAVKFTPEGGQIKVWTHSLETKVYINIADTGVGIPQEDQPYVFERFFKADKSHSTSTPGTGIGLSIVKRIISQHGEKISFKSASGKGTTFTFTLTRAFEHDSPK